MQQAFSRGGLWLAAALVLSALGHRPLIAQTIVTTLNPAEKVGERPYEMVWAKRLEPAPPLVRFDRLEGWAMRVEGGARATLELSRAQNLWGRPVARLRYAGNGEAGSGPRVILLPPQPIPLADGANALDLWIYGNRFDYEPDPSTPPVAITVRLRDASGREHSVGVGMRWKDWFLVHRALPAGMAFPVALESIEVSGGWQAQDREIFLDSLQSYRETTRPLPLAPRPRRNLSPLPGQSIGANTGEAKLDFPTREQTILPAQMGGAFSNRIVPLAPGQWSLKYLGRDGAISYGFDAAAGLSGITIGANNAILGTPLDGAQLRRADGSVSKARLLKAALQKEGGQDVVAASYDDGTSLRLRIWQKSLVIDVSNASGDIADFSLGQLSGLSQPRVFTIPYLTYGNEVNFASPGVLLSKAGSQWVYTSLWLDWYRSNASEPYGAHNAGGSIATINGGARYVPRTDGGRNPLFERLFLTSSPTLEEVLPTIANPVGLHAQQAIDRLWQESWGPLHSYAMEESRSNVLRAYGIEKLIQNNHEFAWRDGGESFTLRTRAAPGKGGDRALQEFVAHQKGLGWLSGLYSNYTDFNTLNENWNPDWVQRAPDGGWREAWARSYALKPLAAAALERKYAPAIKGKYLPTSAYTDVHTAVAPWQYVDFDARLPGAASFAQTFYAYGELLRNDSRAYAAPIFSEGTYHWLYAGLDDGNYAQDGRDLTTEPLLPAFDLYQIHPKQCDIGMGVGMSFVDSIPRGTTLAGLDAAIDRYLVNTLAYGHIGYLVEERLSLERVCRSYFMLQQVQARYGLQAPRRIAYWDGKYLRSTSQAIIDDLPSTRRQLFVEYPSGLKLWLNDSPSEEWRVRIGEGSGREITLPPAGWAAYQPNGVLSFSALNGNAKADYLRSASYTYLDGRGGWFAAPEAASAGGLAIKPLGANTLQVIQISDAPLAPGASNAWRIGRPYGVRGQLVSCEAFDMFGHALPAPSTHDSGAQSWIQAAAVSTVPVKWTPHREPSAPGGVRYVLRFSGKESWNLAPSALEVVPGGTVALGASTPTASTPATAVRWTSSAGTIVGDKLLVPADAAVGSWVRLGATRGGQAHEAWLRVVAPVQWRWRTADEGDSTRLTLLPSWTASGRKPSGVSFQPSAGWTVDSQRVGFAGALPSQVQVLVGSDAPAGAEGTLQITLEGLAQPFTTTLRLGRALPAATVLDFQKARMDWGIARRGQSETPNAVGSGGVFQVAGSGVGGVGKSGLYMHPPWLGGAGYTWAVTDLIQLPDAPAEFRASTGLRDGGDASDGVIFRVEVEDASGARKLLGEQLTPRDQKWHPFAVDLSAYRGQRVRLRLIADPGAADNTSADWAAWGEPVIQLAQPRLQTKVSALALP